MYVANRLTWIDVAKRFQIRGSIAKAMYRFCQSHRENPVFRGDIRTLALALNMDLRSPLKETRRQIRDAIAELAEKKVLEKTSILTKGNIVILNRTAEASRPGGEGAGKRTRHKRGRVKRPFLCATLAPYAQEWGRVVLTDAPSLCMLPSVFPVGSDGISLLPVDV